jgi:hypothetical protein
VSIAPPLDETYVLILEAKGFSDLTGLDALKFSFHGAIEESTCGQNCSPRPSSRFLKNASFLSSSIASAREIGIWLRLSEM